MRDVAVVGFAQRQMAEFDGSPTCVELLVPLFGELYEQTGWTRHDVGFWYSGSRTSGTRVMGTSVATSSTTSLPPASGVPAGRVGGQHRPRRVVVVGHRAPARPRSRPR